MEKKIILLLSLISILGTQAQTPVIHWQKTFGGSALDEATSIKPTADGGYITAGSTFSNNFDVMGNHGGSDYWIVKLNSAGTIEWQKTFGGTGYDYPKCIEQTTDGGYIIAGYTESNNGDVTGNHGVYDFWIVKIDALGVLQWQKTFGGTNQDNAWSIKQTTDGGYIVAGETSSTNGDITTNHGFSDCWIVKLDAAGTIQWQKTFGGTDFDSARSILQTTDGGYMMAGFTRSNDGDVTGNHGPSDYWVVKLDATGGIQWQKSLGGTGFDDANSIVQTTDSGYLVAGMSTSADGNLSENNGNYDYWIIKLNAAGEILWQNSLGGSSIDVAHSIQQTPDGGAIIAGYTSSNDGDVTGNHGNDDLWVVKLGATGSPDWQKTLGGTGSDKAHSIELTADGGYVVAGATFSNNGDVTLNHGNFDYWIVKLGVSTPSPTAAAQSFCNSATVENLIATGDNLKWYDVEEGGLPLQNNTALVTGDYYVSQTINGIESTRTLVPVTITTSVVPTFTQVSAICSGQILEELPATSTNGISGSWLPALNNQATTTYTFTPTTGQCASSAAMTITVITLDTTTALVSETITANQTGGTYQWINCVGNIPVENATSQSFTPVQNGNYAVIISVGDCSVYSECTAITTLSLENPNKRAFIIYPNPATSFLNIEGQEEIKSLRIIDISGKVISKKTVLGNAIDLNDLSAGIYIIEIQTLGGIFREKFIMK